METSPLLILGSSGHAKVIIDIVEKQNLYHIIGLIDANRTIGSETLGYKIVGPENSIHGIASVYENLHLFIAIGDNAIRYKVYKKLIESGINYPFATLIHPNSTIGKNVNVGIGSAVMAGAIINPNSKVGNFVIVNTASSIDHDCQIDDFATIAPGAILGGTVSVGEFSSLSIGSTIKHGIVIGHDSIVGAGATVIKDIPSYEIHVGVPARKLRDRKHGEKYL